MKISSSEELKVLSQVNQDVFNILADFNLSRKGVVSALDDIFCVEVSEKLVRTWREKLARFEPLDEIVEDGFNEDEITELTSFIPALTEERLVNYTPLFLDGSSVKAAKKDQKVIGFGDFQINKHDPEFLAKAIDFVADQQPDIICLTGDESDNSAVGRWAKGMREEFESNLQDQIDETIDWLSEIRDAAPNAQIHMAHSNHMDWITKAVETRLPGFSSLRYLTPEVMYELDDLEIQYQRKLFEFLPGYLLGHGHQWQLTSATHTVKGIEHVLKTGKSILAGHVHQAALRTVFVGYEGKGEQKVYVNPGCMMDFDKAMASNGGYINGTSPNWSKGIVVIHRELGQNYTELVLGETNGTFRYEGKIY